MLSKTSILLKVLFVFTFALGIAACNKDTPDALPDEEDKLYNLVYGGLPAPQIPEDNILTEAGVELGRRLFYDTRLSGDNSISCGSCHLQEFAFTDTARFSTGITGEQGQRQAMSSFNTLWHNNDFFWDGRATLLRDQALMPIQDPVEMNETLENVISKLQSDPDYQNRFVNAFGSDVIDEVKISLALEQFMHSIVSYNSKYDKYLKGEATLTESELRGKELFFAEYNPGFPDLSGADCAHCHSGSNFENDLYINNGLSSDADMTDLGRANVTGNPADNGKFKVTTLRNIELTAPYMHYGRFETLEEVINHYNDGIVASSTLAPELAYTATTGLMLTEEDKSDLVAFLKTLTDYELINDSRYSNPF